MSDINLEDKPDAKEPSGCLKRFLIGSDVLQCLFVALFGWPLIMRNPVVSYGIPLPWIVTLPCDCIGIICLALAGSKWR
ncbi:MAG: hypothetical protein ABSH22_08545, partial [Tepidisphaeraceae bacterium]